MTTLHLKKSIGRSPLRLAFLLIPLALGCFALSQTARAVSPAPDGAYPLGNTAEGSGALQNLTTGVWNTANGFQTLFDDTSGGQNIATGVQALFSNTMGSGNVAIGIRALYTNTTGGNNTATGFQALYSNTTGVENIATGVQALFSNTMGSGNLAIGEVALFGNTTGGSNTAIGVGALLSNKIGNNNVAIGPDALENNTTGLDNIGLGISAGGNLTTGNDNIDIGNPGVAGESNNIRIGDPNQFRTFIAGIAGVTLASGVPVVVDSDGQLGIAGTSSQRFKDQIKPMDKASEAILALKPVTFHYKKGIDPKGIPQFGLVAEEVEKVNPDLVTRDAQGKVYTVRYEAVNAMLLNEFLKEHRKVEQQDATIAKQQKQIEALTTGLQKVSDQLELSKPAPRTVSNNQ